MPTQDRNPPGADAQQRLDAFVAKCGGAVRQNGKETVCHCPAHDDQNPSLNVRLGDDGKLLVTCRAGCSIQSIVDSVDWSMKDLMPSGPPTGGRKRRGKQKKKPKQEQEQKTVYSTFDKAVEAAGRRFKGKVESKYVYRRADSTTAFAVIRVRQSDGKKVMPQARPCDGGWELRGADKPHPVYRLPELLQAEGDSPVCVFEGEKMADVAASLSLTATSCSGGAGKAKHTDLSPLAGRRVYLFADNDGPGQTHMEDLAARAFAASVRSVHKVELPDLPAKGDIVDFCERRRGEGASDDQLLNEIHELMERAEEVPRSSDEQHEATERPRDGDPSVADLLVALAKDAVLFHDGQGETYATIPVADHRESWRIASTHFKQWLAHRYYRAYRSSAPTNSLATAIAQLQAMAQFDGACKPVHGRVAKIGAEVWINLANENWQAIRVTAAGWEVIDNPDHCFLRTAGMKSLPVPQHGTENLDDLFELFRIDNLDDRLLITSWSVNTLLPTSSYPILGVTGEQGSGKTTASRALLRLVDPHEMEGRSPPRSEEDIAVAAQNAHVLCYENMSGIKPHLSDSLCRLSTGSAFSARKLYTDAEERQLRFCRPLILNGIDDLASRSDLADRIVGIALQPIPRRHRRTESELWASFDRIHGRLLGALLGLVVEHLRAPMHDAPLERMAEFSMIGATVARALGHDPRVFADAYKRNRERTSFAALEESAIGPVLLRLPLQDKTSRTVAGWLDALVEASTTVERSHPDWPKSARRLTSQLRRLRPDLGRLAIQVEFHAHRRDGNHVSLFRGADVHHVHGPRNASIDKGLEGERCDP